MNNAISKQCILIIDDKPAQIAALGHILVSRYDVKTATDREAGLKLARDCNIDLILLNPVMQEMSGFSLLSQLKSSQATNHIPVIITGSNSREEEARGLALGAADYLRKPYTDVEIILRVKIHLQLISQMRLIKNISLTDGLTGMNNRRSFDQAIRSIWSYARRVNDWFSLLIIDIDKFKNFNDKYGYLNGDTCLKVVANTIRQTLRRGSDVVYRWGDEEFSVILPGTNINGALFVAECIRKNTAAVPVQFNRETVFVTVSIGVASVSPSPHTDFDDGYSDFFKKVNKALYCAKENGRNRVEAWEQSLALNNSE